MRDYSNGNITTIFPRTLQEKLFTSSTFQTAREELKEKGFINFDDDKTRKEKGTYYDTEKKQLKPIVYTFSDKWQKYKVEKNKKRASNLQKHNEQKKNKGKTQIIQELKDNLQ
jgi:DNA-binding HxlR family transcriptional regulator